MKKYISLFLAAVIAFAFCGCSAKEYKTDLNSYSDCVNVVSFNVAAPWGNIIQGTSAKRVKLFASYMNSVKPDSIGTQEMNSDWLSKLSELMPDYDSYGVQRGGDENEKKSEMNAVFWLKDKYECVEENTFWLSETPEIESRYSGAGCNRVCSYVVLQAKDGGCEYIHMNTHLDNASEEAQNFGMGVILEKMQELQEKYPGAQTVLTGDFNQTQDGLAYKSASEVLSDASKIAKQADEPHVTYTEWGKLDDASSAPIDHIFTSAETVERYAILDDISNGYVSDHYGIFASIRF